MTCRSDKQIVRPEGCMICMSPERPKAKGLEGDMLSCILKV